MLFRTLMPILPEGPWQSQFYQTYAELVEYASYWVPFSGGIETEGNSGHPCNNGCHSQAVAWIT